MIWLDYRLGWLGLVGFGDLVGLEIQLGWVGFDWVRFLVRFCVGVWVGYLFLLSWDGDIFCLCYVGSISGLEIQFHLRFAWPE